MTGLIGTRIEAGEGDEGIALFEGHALERIDQAAANDAADAGDFAQARVVLFAIGIRLDQSLDSRVDAGNELVQPPPQRFEFGGKPRKALERLAERGTDGAELGAALDHALDLALLGGGHDPGVQLLVFAANEPGDEPGIDAVGLAAQSHCLGIVARVLGIEDIDHEVQLVGRLGEQLVVAAGRFHAEAAARGQRLEPRHDFGAAVGESAREEAFLGAGHHDLVLADIGTDIEHGGWGLHGISPVTMLDIAGVGHTPA